MKPTFSTGSLLIARPTAPEDVQLGDIIALPGASQGTPCIVHRVVALVKEGECISALTMGDNNLMPDPAPFALHKPVPWVVWTVPYLGWFVTPFAGWSLLGLGVLLGLWGVLCMWDSRKGETGRTRTNLDYYQAKAKSISPRVTLGETEG